MEIHGGHKRNPAVTRLHKLSEYDILQILGIQSAAYGTPRSTLIYIQRTMGEFALGIQRSLKHLLTEQ